MRDAPLQVKERRTLKGWTIQRCPECHGMVQGATVEHLGDCSNRESAFVVEMVEVVPLSVAEALADALERAVRAPDACTPAEYVQNLRAGREALERHRAAYPPADQLRKEGT